jgi:hypothetical protein
MMFPSVQIHALVRTMKSSAVLINVLIIAGLDSDRFIDTCCLTLGVSSFERFSCGGCSTARKEAQFDLVDAYCCPYLHV